MHTTLPALYLHFFWIIDIMRWIFFRSVTGFVDAGQAV